MAARDRGISPLFASSALDGAITAHFTRFGSYPDLLGLEGRGQDRRLADLIWVAIRVGRPFDAAAVWPQL